MLSAQSAQSSTLSLPAPCYLAGALLFGASTVLAPRNSASSYAALSFMAAAVYCYATSPSGTDFGLAMVFATYVFQVLAIRLICGLPSGDETKLPKTQFDWLLVAFTNPRMIGWGGPVGQFQPRTRFVLRHAAHLFMGLLVIDLCHAYFSLSAWFSHGAPVEGVRIASLPVWKQASHTVAWVIYAYLLWFVPYHLFALVSVACRLSEPAAWPRLFDSWDQAHSVTALWGATWHQAHRRTYSTIADAVCRAVYGPQGPRPASAQYLKVAVAFSVSGVVHAAGSLALPPDPITGSRGCRGALLFFGLQAIGVGLERFASRNTSIRLPRIVGHVWLVTWGISTLVHSGWMDELVARRSIPPGVQSILLQLIR